MTRDHASQSIIMGPTTIDTHTSLNKNEPAISMANEIAA